MQNTYDIPEQHIARIREEKFALSADGSLVRQNPLSEDLQRAIAHLSEGLYSKETHFILELIQNAEDNHYAEQVKPDLTFLLLSQDPTGTQEAEGSLLIINNEAGFRAADVKALCAVGETTKKKREGYVGEKGIGFKSVFVVSSQPHVFSNGYQFRFQERPDPQAELGYIVPYWVSDVPPELQRYGGKTCIILPLKAGKREEVVKELGAIAPETILFLSKLQGLTIQIGDEEPIEVIRDDSKRPLVQFVTGEEYVEFWVADYQAAAPSDLHEEKREGITTRKVSVALPLKEIERFKGRVFAFLPTEVNSGLPFLLNGDFILSASRETIQFDRPWNRWLRDCIAPTFIQAFEGLLSDVPHWATAYAHIPLVDGVQEEFFLPSVEAIYSGLRERAVVWTLNDEGLVKPSEARLAPFEFRELINPGNLPAQLRKTPLVHPKIQTYREQLKSIGVKSLSHDEISCCLQDDAWLDTQNLDWFVRLYKYLQRQSWATEEWLRGLNLLPVDGGGRTSSGAQSVYLPTNEAHEILAVNAQISSVLDIAFLSPELYAVIRDDQMLIKWLTDTLGVQTPTRANYCLDLARALNERRNEVEVSDLVRLTAYIRDQFADFDDDTKRKIRWKLPLVLADGRIITPEYWWDHLLVMPATIDPETGWQLVYAEPEDRAHLIVLSDDYLVDCNEKDEIQKWQEFFEELWATSAPPPEKKRWEWDYSTPDDLTSYARRIFNNNRRYSTRGHILTDWVAPRWLGRLKETDELIDETKRRAFALLQWLQRQASKIDQSYRAEYKWHYRSWYSRKPDSEFQHYLRNAPWFPSTQGLKKPNQVFLDKPELREIFGDALPYAIENPGQGVANWLNLRQTATSDDLMAYLKELAAQPAEQVDRKLVEKIYTFLTDRQGVIIKDEFEKHPLILVTKPQPRWVTARQAVWPDLSAVFDDTYAYLETQYDRRFEGFFIERVGVAARLDQELFAEAWLQLAQADNLEPEKIEAALERIYPELLKVAKESKPPDWWADFRRQAKVWTQNDRFIRAHTQRVYVPDDGDLKRLFADSAKFVWRPEKASFAEYWPLYQALGVKSLVENVKITAEPERVITDADIEPLLTPAAKKAICLHLYNNSPTTYAEVKGRGSLEKLLRTREHVVERLTVSYELTGTGSLVEVTDGVAFWDREKAVVYYSGTPTQEQLEIDVPTMLARQLTGGREYTNLEHFIGRVLGASEEKTNGLKRKHNWALPTAEKQWVDEALAALGDSDDGGAANGRIAETDDTDSIGENGKEDEFTREADTSGVGADIDRSDATGSDSPPADTSGGTSTGTGTDGDSGSNKRRPDIGGGTAPGSGASSTPEIRFRRRRLSYVEPKIEAGDGGAGGEGGSQEERTATERAAVEMVLLYERKQGRDPEEKERTHEGYDIESYVVAPVAAILDATDKRRLDRIIEVKGTKYPWDGWGVSLTSPEYRAAQKYGDQYYLYVVANALDPVKRKLYIFQDPVGKVDEYCFDHNWSVVADETVTLEQLDTD